MDLLEQKEQEYLAYINEHILNVQKAFELYLLLFDCDNTSPYNIILKHNIKKHDQSKFGIEEFDAYRRHFHSIDETEKEESKDDFEKAWEHHYSVNKHHSEYWFDENGNPKEMNHMYVIEMICDWIAMSIKFCGNPYEWYKENVDSKIKLHDNTKKLVESLLLVVDAVDVSKLKEFELDEIKYLDIQKILRN